MANKISFLIILIVMFCAKPNANAQMLPGTLGLITAEQYVDSNWVYFSDTLITYSNYQIITSLPAWMGMDVHQTNDTIREYVFFTRNDTIYGYFIANYVATATNDSYRKYPKYIGFAKHVNNAVFNEFNASLKSKYGISIKQEDVFAINTKGLKAKNKRYEKGLEARDNKQVFSTWVCGYALPPDLSIRFSDLTDKHGVKAAKRWLYSASYVKRCYAIYDLYTRYTEGGYTPSTRELKTIYKTKFSTKEIQTCSGCMSSKSMIRLTLSHYNFIK